MNKAILMGRLARDPELRQTPNGVAVARFAIAVQRRFAKEGQQQADFIECVAWRSTAEFISKYFHKGSMIAVTGTIQTRSWDGADGKKRYATEVIVDETYFTGEKANGGTANDTPPQPTGNFDANGFDSFPTTNMKEDDLPFDTN